MSETTDPNPFDDIQCRDEKHIAVALYLLQKAISLRQLPEEGGWPEIHACLRDAGIAIEKARQYWTKEAVQHRREIIEQVFGKEA